MGTEDIFLRGECASHSASTLPSSSQFCASHSTDYVDISHSHLIAIDRLPVELITQIFLYCLPPEIRERRPSRKLAPLLLSCVCSRWRAVSLSVSRLWDTLSVIIESHEVVNVKGYGQAAKHWFDRVGEHATLTLTLQACDPTENEHRNANALLNEIVVPYAKRLRHVDLCFQHYDDVPTLWKQDDDSPNNNAPVLDGSFEQLEHLSLNFYDYPDVGYPVTAFENAPHLCTVELWNATPWDSPEISLQWSRLTSLDMSDIHSSLWFTLLPQCVNLQCGKFSFLEVGFEDPNSISLVSGIRMPNLLELTVVFGDRSNSSPYIFNGFYFPALSKFEFAIDHPDVQFSWSNPEHLYQQLRNITTLSLGDDIPAPDIIELLRHTTKVTNLDVCMGDDHSVLLSALHIYPPSEILLPKLEKVSVHTSCRTQTMPFSVGKFVSMIVSRSGNRSSRPVSPLRHVELIVPPVPNNLKERVQARIEPHSGYPGFPRMTYRRPF